MWTVESLIFMYVCMGAVGVITCVWLAAEWAVGKLVSICSNYEGKTFHLKG